MICSCPAASADCRLSVSTSTVELLMTGLPAAAHATTVHLYTSVQLLHKLHNNLKNSKPACKCSFKHQCNNNNCHKGLFQDYLGKSAPETNKHLNPIDLLSQYRAFFSFTNCHAGFYGDARLTVVPAHSHLSLYEH